MCTMMKRKVYVIWVVVPAIEWDVQFRACLVKA